MKILLSLVFICAFASFGFGQSSRIKTEDLQVLIGTQWTGTLTYLDYSSNKEVSILSNLIVSQSEAGKSSFVFDYQYPDEPKANDKATVKISRNGKTISGEKVIEKTKLADGTLKIITEKSGTDDDKNALFRFTYLITKNSFSIRKEVKYDEANGFFVETNTDGKDKRING